MRCSLKTQGDGRLEFFYTFLGIVGLITFWFVFTGDRQSEESLQAELQRASSAITPELFVELKALLDDRKKLAAIKRLREETGCGLYVAKQIVDAI